MAHIKQSRPYSGLDFQVKVLKLLALRKGREDLDVQVAEALPLPPLRPGRGSEPVWIILSTEAVRKPF